jgi:polyisoprenoid-binding protein YceI
MGLRLATAVLFALAAATGAAAQEVALDLDPAATRVDFTLGATLHTVHGTFHLKRGSIRFDPATGKASGELVVDATSGNTGNDGRDHKMHKTILESGLFPEIVFTADRVTGQLSGPAPWQAQLHGRFRIHGAEHELVLPIEARLGPGSFTATTRFAVPYLKWGMKDPSTFILKVGDTVNIEIQAAGRVSK